MEDYFVPFSDAESEFTEKRSRFVSMVFRVETEEQAKEKLEEVRRKLYDARHHCWCYRLHDGTVRYSDAGEPQGTAGQPMLNVFEREGVENVCCVVTRYFGGVLLGAGGLTRAYGRAAKDALDAAGVARMCPWQFLRVVSPYPFFERFKLLVSAHGGILEDTDYGTEIAARLRLPVSEVGAFEDDLRERSLGAVSAEHLQTDFLPGGRER